MQRFLLIDDSALARQIVKDLLKKSFDAIVVEAGDGLEALRCLEEQGPFDLILSDLQMPKMDGLGLLAIVREKFPGSPLVMMTAFGNEEIAVQAIQEGAASYISKSQLRSRLPDVVTTVLNAATRRKVRDRLTKYIVSNELVFRLTNDRKLLSATVAELQEIGQATGAFDDQQLTRIGVALEESLLNAMIHGNLEVSSQLRNREDNAFDELIALRQQTAPYCDRRIQIRCRFTPAEARFMITDEGPGFDVSKVPDPTNPENFLRPSGRGLLLIRTFMDEVTYNSQGNSITLVKRQRSSPASL